MPSEIAAFVQSQIQAQTPSLSINNTSSDTENSQPGLFASLMSEYISPEEGTADQTAITNSHKETAQLITFTGNNSFSQSVIDILAGLNDTQKDTGNEINGIISKIKSLVSGNTEIPNDIDELISRIINDENIPEDTKNEIMNSIDELLNVIRNSELIDDDVKKIAFKFSDIIHDTPKAGTPVVDADDNAHDDNNGDVVDVEDDDDIIDEAGDISVSMAGSSLVPNSDSVHDNTVNASEPEAESHPEIPDMNTQSQSRTIDVQAQTLTHEARNITTHKADTKHQNESESRTRTEDVNHESGYESSFDEHLELSDNQNGTSNQNQNLNAQAQSQNGNSSGQEENSHEHNQPDSVNTSSQTRNESRRTSGTSTRTQNERTETNSHRTESHNTFQSFFEGVLSSRRNVSRTSPLPLNLSQNQQTASYTLNQSQTLRDGMINVVRFIRADGVHKANVVIDPPALGRVSVELSSTSSGVEASIKVASEQIRQLVQDQLSELRMNLSQQGVQVAEFTVDVQQDNSNGNNQNHNDEGNRYRTFAVREAEDETEEFRIDLEEGLLYWVA